MVSPADSARTVVPDPAKKQPQWLLLGLIAALLLACYAPVLKLLVSDWINDENVGHGFFVPLVAGYLVWQKKDELLSIRTTTNWLGLVIVVLAGLQLYAATLGAEMFLARTSFVFSIFGIVLFLGGTAVLRALAFPLVLLFFMIPLPSIIYNQITFPLQLLASRFAEATLSMAGIPVIREGNILELPSQRLSVVEACSGIRSLLSLTFLSLVYGYFFDRRTWVRVTLFVSTIPIAILANAGRVTMTGILGEYDKDLATGAFHMAEGWVIFMIALVMLLLTHQLIIRVYGLIRRNHPSAP